MADLPLQLHGLLTFGEFVQLGMLAVLVVRVGRLAHALDTLLNG